MSNAVSEVPSAEGSSDPGSVAASEAFGVHVSTSPPLSWLAAVAALCAMGINQLLVPAIAKETDRTVLRTIEHWGAFSTNLAVIAGLVALAFGLFALVRYNTVVLARQRVTVGLVALFFLPTIAVAALFERHRITAQLVLVALALAQLLSVHVSLCAVRAARSRYVRVIALFAAALATCALVFQVLEQISQVRASMWQTQAQTLLQRVGEGCYLLVLAGMAPLLLPLRSDARSRVAHYAGFFFLPVVLGALYFAERTLDNDYQLLLYHAQRVTLFIDSWPRLYSLPIGLAVASSLAAVLGNDPVRRQAAAGVLLLLASGYAPLAPGRLLTSALAFVLIARAMIATAHPDLPPIAGKTPGLSAR